MWQQHFIFKTLADKESFAFALPDGLGTLKLSIRSENILKKNRWQVAIKAPLFDQKITIRFTHDNPKCLPQYRQHSRALKKVLQELSYTSLAKKKTAFYFL